MAALINMMDESRPHLTDRIALLHEVRQGRPKPSPVDKMVRSGEDEQRLDQTAAIVFSTGAGREFLDYLNDITIQNIADFTISNEGLRQLEGARWIVNVINERVRRGRKTP